MKSNGTLIQFPAHAPPWWRVFIAPGLALAAIGAVCAGAVAVAQVGDLRVAQDKQAARIDAVDARVQRHAETLARLDVLVDRLEKAAQRIDPGPVLRAPASP